MILDVLQNISRYSKLGTNYQIAIDFLLHTDLQMLPSGKIDIDADHVFAFVSDSDLQEDNMTWELHRQYSDIQLVLDGKECIGYTTTANLTSISQSGDCFLFAGETSENKLQLGENMFAIFFPFELHRPGCPVGRRSHSKKIVLKILDERCCEDTL